MDLQILSASYCRCRYHRLPWDQGLRPGPDNQIVALMPLRPRDSHRLTAGGQCVQLRTESHLGNEVMISLACVATNIDAYACQAPQIVKQFRMLNPRRDDQVDVDIIYQDIVLDSEAELRCKEIPVTGISRAKQGYSFSPVIDEPAEHRFDAARRIFSIIQTELVVISQADVLGKTFSQPFQRHRTIQPLMIMACLRIQQAV